MHRNREFLAILVAVGLVAASGMAMPRMAPEVPEPAETAVLSLSQTGTLEAPACSEDFLPPANEIQPASLPGCCSTQCNVDKDCDKICGKGNCACLQQTPCCRRCVY
jgi:hypothetical protein